MLYIKKGPCPEEIQQKIEQLKARPSWSQIPSDPGTLPPNERHIWVKKLRKNYFDALPKDKIREALLKEQHYICAYCMLPIENDGRHMTIEHFYPLSRDKDKALDYDNLLGVCNGGRNIHLEDGEERVICCDAQKDDYACMVIDPRNEEMMNLITYGADGIIEADESEVWQQAVLQHDIDEVLRLNGKLDADHNCALDTTTALVKKRRDAFRKAEEFCTRRRTEDPLTLEMLDEKIKRCLEAEHREEMAGVSLYVYRFYRERLKRRINKD